MYGYFDGLEKGYSEGYASVNFANLLSQYDGQAPIGEATKIGFDKAQSAVLTDVASTIVQRHRNALRKSEGQSPVTINETPDFKKENYTYQGYAEGHKLVKKNFWGNLETQYRNNPLSLEEQLKYKYLKDNKLINAPCDLSTAKFFLLRNSVISGYYNNFNYFDYYYYQDKIDFAIYGWKDPNWAWDFLVRENPNQSYSIVTQSIKDKIVPVTTTTKVEKKRYIPVPKLFESCNLYRRNLL